MNTYKENWEKSYLAGNWNYLFSPEELGRYLIILGYIVYVCRARRVLDAGCGAGRLLELLLPYQLERYVGFDVSTEAIKQCSQLACQSPNTELHVIGMDNFSTAEDFDMVVFNESICYSADPVGLLKKATGWLAPNGALVISMCRDGLGGNHEEYWGMASSSFTTSHATVISNRLGQTWDIRVFYPK